jgi:hypothetical protein
MPNWFKKEKPPEPRDLLFGDLPLEQWPRENTAAGEPWRAFIEARTRLKAGDKAEAIRILRGIQASVGLESRHYLQAWHFLRELGVKPATEQAKRLYGVIVEVGMDEGVDILVAYADHNARYFNYTGAAIIWERPDGSLDQSIKSLLDAGRAVVELIGPWENARPPVPGNGSVRINLLTPSGLHFGQGAFEVLARDPMGGPVIGLATRLMQELIAKTKEEKA